MLSSATGRAQPVPAVWAFAILAIEPQCSRVCRQDRLRNNAHASDSLGFNHCQCATAGLTTGVLDGTGLRRHQPTRMTPYAACVQLLSIGSCSCCTIPSGSGLTTTPLRFARTSPPSDCPMDFHPQAAEHARHTTKKGERLPAPPVVLPRRTGVRLSCPVPLTGPPHRMRRRLPCSGPRCHRRKQFRVRDCRWPTPPRCRTSPAAHPRSRRRTCR